MGWFKTKPIDDRPCAKCGNQKWCSLAGESESVWALKVEYVDTAEHQDKIKVTCRICGAVFYWDPLDRKQDGRTEAMK